MRAVGRVDIADAGAVRTITLSHPEKKNALTRGMLAAVQEGVADLPAAIRAVVLTGQGGVFSSGFFLDQLDDEERARGINPIDAAAAALESCAVPVVAAIEGVCMGGAVELAVSCALTVVHPATTVGIPACRFGLVYPEEGIERLVRRIGPAAARRLLLPATTMSGHEAVACGVFGRRSEQVLDDGQACAQAIADNGPLAVDATRRAIDAFAQGGAVTDTDREAMRARRQRVLASLDLQEGLAAAREKRAPVFVGQ